MSSVRILNLQEVDWQSWSPKEGFSAELGDLARPLGAEKLGYRVVRLSPGETAWPAHAHLVNEEMFFIMQGEGTLRWGEATYPIVSGDVIAVPAGEKIAHQIINTGEAVLQYLAVSTMLEPDIVLCPDTEVVGVLAGSAPGGDKSQRTFNGYFKLKHQQTYCWDDD